jgi:hypothetical protein
LRRKRHDSINPSIGKNRRLFQCLQACWALRESGCGFFAASFAIPVDFQATLALLPNRGHAAATPSP